MFTSGVFVGIQPLFFVKWRYSEIHFLPNMNHFLRQVSGKKTSLGLLLLWDVLYLPLNSAITLAGESHVVGHNDTWDIAILL